MKIEKQNKKKKLWKKYKFQPFCTAVNTGPMQIFCTHRTLFLGEMVYEQDLFYLTRYNLNQGLLILTLQWQVCSQGDYINLDQLFQQQESCCFPRFRVCRISAYSQDRDSFGDPSTPVLTGPSFFSKNANCRWDNGNIVNLKHAIGFTGGVYFNLENMFYQPPHKRKIFKEMHQKPSILALFSQ